MSRRHSDPLVRLLEDAHELLLDTWVNQVGTECGENCIMQCVAVANGQGQDDWTPYHLKGVGKAAAELLDFLATDETVFVTSYGEEYPLLDAVDLNDMTGQTLQTMSDLMLDAIEIAKAEAA